MSVVGWAECMSARVVGPGRTGAREHGSTGHRHTRGSVSPSSNSAPAARRARRARSRHQPMDYDRPSELTLYFIITSLAPPETHRTNTTSLKWQWKVTCKNFCRLSKTLSDRHYPLKTRFKVVLLFKNASQSKIISEPIYTQETTEIFWLQPLKSLHTVYELFTLFYK